MRPTPIAISVAVAVGILASTPPAHGFSPTGRTTAACGSFDTAGLASVWNLRATGIPCRTARRQLLDWLRPRRYGGPDQPAGWRCYGSESDTATRQSWDCTQPRKRIRFQLRYPD